MKKVDLITSLYNCVQSNLKNAKGFTMDHYNGACPIGFNLGGRWFVIDVCPVSNIISLQENLEGYEADTQHIGALCYESKYFACIEKRIKELSVNPNAQIKGAKLI